MSINKSIINDVQLDDDSEVYFQVSSYTSGMNISFDDSTSSYGKRVTMEDAIKIRDSLIKTIEEAQHESSTSK